MSCQSGKLWRERVNFDFGEILNRHKALIAKLSDIEIIRDQKTYTRYLREMKEIEPVIEAIGNLRQAEEKIADADAMIAEETEKEMKELAETEKQEWIEKKDNLEEQIQEALAPKDTRDVKNVILEIRAGTGGDEASLFAADLMQMYLKYTEEKKMKAEIMHFSETEIKGLKEVILLISGKNAYGTFKHETGTHRVQRIPETENSGRIHTSAVTVAVLPEVEETEIEIEEKDIRIETFRASGAGGQHVNTTDSAVRIIHLPTHTMVTCQDERSQQKNKQKAMKVLRARVSDTILAKQISERAEARKSQVGSGDRSERIRTYNFPQSRVTDHRIGKTIHKLDMFLAGDMDEMLEALKVKEREDRVRQMTQPH